MTLREVMHSHLPTLDTANTIRDTVDKMDIYQFPALVITDDEHRPLAVITEGDISRAIHGADSLLSIGGDPALAYATKDPVTLPGTTEIGEALYTMLNRGLTVIPVMEGESMAGIVLRMDLMQALLADAAGG
ncbi:MAG: CBS domain-containing protein [Fimbriimonadaceae bacterium]|nr:CBS domain-containing protein [Fimbriimonadaceae bacterium]